MVNVSYKSLLEACLWLTDRRKVKEEKNSNANSWSDRNEFNFGNHQLALSFTPKQWYFA